MKFSKDSIFRRKLEAISDAVLEDILPMPDWQSRSAMFWEKTAIRAKQRTAFSMWGTPGNAGTTLPGGSPPR